MTQVSQQQYRKVKLKLEQPAIVCSGRKRVSCTYRGHIVEDTEDSYEIIFKSYGEFITVVYDKETGKFLDEQWQDLKIIS